MKSKWYGFKPQAIELRRNGNSLRNVAKVLNIPKSTLSGWFRDITLTPEQQLVLRKNWLENLRNARRKAVVWHNQQKVARLKEAEQLAMKTLESINISNLNILELALAMLYLAEGAKSAGTLLGNSDPLILKFFVAALEGVYCIDVSKISAELHLRADQNPEEMKRYWSRELNLPLDNFKSVSIDKRTAGSPTYPTYKGVCVLYCGNIALQRRLVYLSRGFCEKIANLRAVSSVGRASA